MAKDKALDTQKITDTAKIEMLWGELKKACGGNEKSIPMAIKYLASTRNGVSERGFNKALEVAGQFKDPRAEAYAKNRVIILKALRELNADPALNEYTGIIIGSHPSK